MMCGAFALAAAVIATAAAAGPEGAMAILEFGGSGEWGWHGGGTAYGPNVAFEVTPIENWLEIEAGTTPFIRSSGTEWDTDLLFKKPWTLSETVEFMAGVGPSWSHTRYSDNYGIEAAGDFMVWPWGDSRFGYYVEPSYGYGFDKAREQSFSLSAGLLVAVP